MDPLSLVLKSTLLLAAAALVGLSLRRRSAAARHLVWLLAFAALPALPLLTRTLPSLPVAAPGVLFSTTVTAGGPAAPALAAGASPAAMNLTTLWALGAAVLLLHLAVSLYLLRRLSLRTTGRHPILRSAPAGSMPLTFGLIRPVILLPADAAQWPATRRRHVVLHEIAHIRRHDFALQLFARCVLALYWWQPLAWYAWRRLVTEREVAADDLVLSRGVRPSEYAQNLLSVAAALPPVPFAIAVARRLPLETRLRSILSTSTARTAPGKRATVLAVLACCLAMLPLATVSAQAPQQNPPALTQGIDALNRKAYEEAYERFGTLEPARAALWQAITRERQGQAAAAEERFELAVSLYSGNDPAQLAALRLYERFLMAQPGRDAAVRVVQSRQVPIVAHLNAQAKGAPASSAVRRIGGGVSSPRLLTKVEPQYSEEARAAKVEGTVVVSVEINAEGRPENIRVIRGLGLGLDEQARDAVAEWKFEPGREGGLPVAVRAIIEVNFRLM